MQTNLKPITEIRKQFGDKVARAAESQRPIKRGRRLGDIFTREVLEYLYKRHRAPNAPEPLALRELGEKNGLIEVSQSTMHGLMGRLNLNLIDTEPETEDNAEPAAEPEEEDVVEDTSTVGSPAPMPNGITITPASIPTDFNIVTLPAPLIEPLPAEFTPLVNALGQIIGELNGIPGVRVKAAVSFEWEVAG